MVNNMENAEEVMQILDRFTRLKQKEIPKELDDYLQYVAKTGDTVFKWSSLKYLFREKLLNVIKHFHDTTPRVDEIPQYPNVDPFNYESMKSSLLERLELFNAAPFTIQRLCELLIDPRKQYSRIDKFMRALEKNILVVSTIEPGRKRTESENGDSLDSVVNGDLSLDVNVDIDMENEALFNLESQNGSNGNGSSVSAAALPAVDVKEKSSGAAVAMETPNVPHTADDDILPHPKKAKLDLDFDEENGGSDVGDAAKPSENNGTAATETKASASETVSAAVPKVENNSSDGNGDEKKKSEGEAVQAEKHTSEVVQVAGNKADASGGEKKPTTEDKNTAAAKPGVDPENAAEKAGIEDVPEKKLAAGGKPIGAEQKPPGEAKTKPVTSAIEVDGVKLSSAAKAVEKPASTAALIEVSEEESIVEKEELEKSEKVETAGAKAPAVDVTVAAEQRDAVSAIQGNEAAAKENAAAMIEEKESAPGAQLPATKISAATTKTTVLDVLEQAIGDIGAAKSPLLSSSSSSIEKTIPKAAAAATAEAEAKSATTPIAPVSATGSEEVGTAVSSTNDRKATADAADAGPAVKASAVAKAQVVEEEAKVKAQPTAEEGITSSTGTTTAKTHADKTETAASDVPKPNRTEKAEEEKEKQPGTTIPTTTATENVKAAAVPAVESAKASTSPAAGVAPTLSLNDQPMEDVLLEEVPPPPPASAGVEEVVMAETAGAAGAGGTADVMATEMAEPEPTKDEPAGMEVDDTSQEAMDQ